MKFLDHTGWRVSVDEFNQNLHILLFLRESYGLDQSRNSPPRLLSVDYQAFDSANFGSQETASIAWNTWWQSVLNVEEIIAQDLLARDINGISIDAMSEIRRSVFDPPDFESLRELKSLQWIARNGLISANRWISSLQSRAEHSVLNRSRGERFAAEVANSLQFNVHPNLECSVSIICLNVHGRWWQVPRPGILLCSNAIFEDAKELAQAFRSAIVGM